MFALLRHLKVRHAMLVGSSHGGELSIESTVGHPVWSKNLCWSALSCTVIPTPILNRVLATLVPVQKNDLAAALTKIANDKYLTAIPGSHAKGNALRSIDAVRASARRDSAGFRKSKPQTDFKSTSSSKDGSDWGMTGGSGCSASAVCS